MRWLVLLALGVQLVVWAVSSVTPGFECRMIAVIKGISYAEIQRLKPKVCRRYPA